METIVVVNKKGGVGKTNTVFHLAGELARRGKKVLCVDVDFQANLTAAFLGDEATHSLPVEKTACATADPAAAVPFADELILDTPIPGIALIPGSLQLEDLDSARPEDLPTALLLRLAVVLHETAIAAEPYDFVLIDCHPGKGLLTYQALLAADHVIVPINPENSGARGVGPMLALFDQVRRRKGAAGNCRLRCAGLLLNRVEPRVAVHQNFERALRDDYENLVFATTIPKATAYTEALGKREPVWKHEPKGKAAERMTAFTTELISRITPNGKG